MQLSIHQMLQLIDKRGLGEVFASVMFANCNVPEYVLTQDNVDAVAKKLDDNREAIPAIGTIDLFGGTQTPDTWHDACKAMDMIEDDLRLLVKTLKLDTPSAWRE